MRRMKWGWAAGLRTALPLLTLLAVLLLAPQTARADAAADVTTRCTLSFDGSKAKHHNMLDRDYTTSFAVKKGGWLQVDAPKGETLSGVYVQFYDHPSEMEVQISGHAGWVETVTGGEYLTQWFPVPEGTTALRLQNRSKGRMWLAEITVYGAGDVPNDVPRWRTLDKADLMLMVAHPDDELLWFGGLLPTYAGERGAAVQVAYIVPTTPRRRLELLDGLWHCGVTAYPAFGAMRDVYSGTLKGQYKLWSRKRLETQVIGLIRRYQPEVLVTHDLMGEYGHGAHKAVADSAARCVRMAAEEKQEKVSAKLYGSWQVKKLYVHLYLSSALHMDWHAPLSAFGGRNGIQVAADAFALHTSQQNRGWAVADGGEFDSALYGLYESTVGEDTKHDDFLENITLDDTAADDDSLLVWDEDD